RRRAEGPCAFPRLALTAQGLMETTLLHYMGKRAPVQPAAGSAAPPHAPRGRGRGEETARSDRLQVLDQVLLLLRAEAQLQRSGVVVHHGGQVRGAAVVEVRRV